MNYIKCKDKPSLAIITLYGNYNYGNKLQNYATQEYFKSIGFDVATVPYIEEEYDKPILLNYIVAHLKSIVFKCLRKLKIIKTIRRSELYLRRKKKFKLFSDQHLVLYKKIMYSAIPRDFKTKFDFFVTGSDQVWHCTHNDPKELEYFFLTFSDECQRVTMSPSFGFDTLPNAYIDIYKKGIKGFQNISCREKTGIEIIKKYTKVAPVLLLDPCMLVDESIWLSLMKKPELFNEEKGYILLYSLGGISDDLQNQVRCMSYQKNLEIIDLYSESDEKFVTTGPEEFLYYIKHATLIITDSFHAVLFSILFKQPFYVYYRNDNKSMNNRISTILERFALEDTVLCDNRRISLDEQYIQQYERIEQILQDERQKAIDFYRKTFKTQGIDIMKTI